MFRSNPSNSDPASNTSSSAMARTERMKASREGALRIKQLQEAALAALPQRKLHVVLYIRSDPPIANDFHWAFYYHNFEDGGTKYHMTNIGPGWIADHGTTRGVFKSNFLCVIIEIGGIPAAQEGTLDQIMRSHDDSANDAPGFTCRVWVLTIITRLIQAGLLRCEDLAALEQECFDFGNACMVLAARNDQPRPVVVSSRCS